MIITKPFNYDKYFCNICLRNRSKSTCLRRHVSAVITKDNKYISSGFNGAPNSVRNCVERGTCIRDTLNIPSGQNAEMCYVVHAEQVAISNVNRMEDLKGSTLYVSTSPCSICVKLILFVGIKRIVVCGEQYPDEFATQLINESNLVIDYVSNE